MRTRAVIFSTLASAATLTAGWAAWAVPHAAQATATAASASATDTPSATSTPSASASASASASTSATATPTPTPTQTQTQAAAAAFGGYTGTVDGSAISYRYGTMQVSVTLSGGTITEVTVLQAPSSGKDAQYTNRSVPVLHDEALSTQSANISIVSGATYTSEAYIQSLQSALDQL